MFSEWPASNIIAYRHLILWKNIFNVCVPTKTTASINKLNIFVCSMHNLNYSHTKFENMLYLLHLVGTKNRAAALCVLYLPPWPYIYPYHRRSLLQTVPSSAVIMKHAPLLNRHLDNLAMPPQHMCRIVPISKSNTSALDLCLLHQQYNPWYIYNNCCSHILYTSPSWSSPSSLHLPDLLPTDESRERPTSSPWNYTSCSSLSGNYNYLACLFN
jgi:hypothetical protein